MKKLYLLMLTAMIMVPGNVMAQKDADHPWAGNYTLMLVDDDPLHFVPEEPLAKWNIETPDTFDVKIEWNDEKSMYLVTKFYNKETSNLPNGGFVLEVLDDKNAQIKLVKDKFFAYGIEPADTLYEEWTKWNEDSTEILAQGVDTIIYKETVAGLQLTDETSSPYSIEKPVTVYMNSDGQISLGGFQVLFIDNKYMGWVVWSDGAVPLNGGDEPEAIEPRDWTGTYWMTIPQYYYISLDGNEYPEAGAFEVAKDESGNYLVTKFLGYDTAEANIMFSGGIYLTPSKKNANKATIDCELYMNLLKATDDMGMEGLVLCDSGGENGSIGIEWDEATQTVFFDSFYFMYWSAMGGTPTEAAMYFAAEAVVGGSDGITVVSAQKNDDKTIYDLTGRRVTNPQQGHLYIVNGKKVVIK